MGSCNERWEEWGRGRKRVQFAIGQFDHTFFFFDFTTLVSVQERSDTILPFFSFASPISAPVPCLALSPHQCFPSEKIVIRMICPQHCLHLFNTHVLCVTACQTLCWIWHTGSSDIMVHIVYECWIIAIFNILFDLILLVALSNNQDFYLHFMHTDIKLREVQAVYPRSYS